MKLLKNEKYYAALKGAISGDQDALNQFLEIISPIVLYITYSVLKNHHDSEDAAQEAIISIIKNVQKVDRPETFEAWMYKASINAAIDIKRKMKRRVHIDAAPIETYSETIEENSREYLPPEYAEDEERRKLLKSVINELPLQQRLCVLMYYYGDLSNKQIAEILDINDKSVNKNLYLARKKIRKKLEQETNAELNAEDMLYGSLPVPVLSALFQKDITATVTAGAAKSVVAGAQAKMLATAAASAITMLEKIILIIVSASAIIITSTFVIINANGEDQNSAAEDVSKNSAAQTYETKNLSTTSDSVRLILTLEDLIGAENANKLRSYVKNGVDANTWYDFLSEIGAEKKCVFLGEHTYNVNHTQEQDKQLIIIDRTNGNEFFEVAFYFCDLSEQIPEGLDIYFCFDEWRIQN